MKLLECHISGFGAFRDYRLSFDEGLNIILQPNGWGKTTLSAYIKAMLYGFERKRIRDVSENERLRYKPWSGAKYGGTLDFEHKGEIYRVLREFGASPASDKLKILNLTTGKALVLDKQEVGEWLFELDAQAFTKSVFVGQTGFSFDGTSTGLRNRLNALVSENNDVQGLEKAQAALDARRKFYKKVGGRGYISEVSAKMARHMERQKNQDQQIAQLDLIQKDIIRLDSDIAQLAEQEAQLQKQLDAALAKEREGAGIRAAYKQLLDQKAAAEAAYKKEQATLGKLPGEEELNAFRKLIDAQERTSQAIALKREALSEIEAQRAALLESYAGGTPTKKSIDRHKSELDELAHQLELIGLSAPEETSEYDFIDDAFAADPLLLDKVDGLIRAWPGLEKNLQKADLLSRQIEAENASWDERRAHILRAQEDARAYEAELPQKPQEELANYKKQASTLRNYAKEIQSLEAQRDSLVSQVQAHTAERDAFGTLTLVTEADLKRIDALEKKAHKADEAYSQARADIREAEATFSKSLEDTHACGTNHMHALEYCREQEALLADAQNAYDQAARALEEERLKQAAQQKKGRLTAASIALVGVAIAAALGLFVQIFAGIAVALVALLASVFSYSKLTATSSDGECEDLAALATELEKQKDKTIQARNKEASAQEQVLQADALHRLNSAAYEKQKQDFEEACISSEQAKAMLVDQLSSWMPQESFRQETILVEVGVYVTRLRDYAQKTKDLAALEKKLQNCTNSLAAAQDSAQKLIASIDPTLGHDCLAAADTAMEYASELDAAISKSRKAHAYLEDLLLEFSGKSRSKMKQKEYAALLSSINSNVSPRVAPLQKELDELNAKHAAFTQKLNPCLAVFDLEQDLDQAVAVERLSTAVAAYRTHRAKTAEAMRSTEKLYKQAEALTKSLTTWAQSLGLSSIDSLTDQVFAELSADAARLERLEWDMLQMGDTIEKLTKEKAQYDKSSKSFLQSYKLSSQSSAAQALAELSLRSKQVEELRLAAQRANKELSAWMHEHERELNKLKNQTEGQESQKLKQIILGIQATRETSVAERAQLEEKGAALRASLEDYLVCAQQMRLLAQQKQEATTKLFTIQKTAEFLEKAQSNQDKRYLGGLGDRFNDYATSWLGHEGLDVAIADDFAVAVSDASGAHSIASYSTGYQDLLDICLRMALVDTIFETEQPFIVMDDPFVSLDQEKISRAMLMLALLAQKKQIIYFTCHPSRMQTHDAEEHVSFTLPEQRPARELPRARAKREALERSRAQAELVASYHVEPTTKGRAGLALGHERRTITSNIINLSFVVDPESGLGDNVFDVHFIDEKGRALCERSVVEVLNGRVVPEKLRLSLATQDDSGSRYDLIIHEQDRPDSELADRIGFKAAIAFGSHDFAF